MRGGRVFVSYADADRDVIERIRQELERRGMGEIVFDVDDVEPGVDVPSAIREALRVAEAMVVVVSAAGLRSAWVRHELGAAVVRQIPVIQVVGDRTLLRKLPPVDLRQAIPLDEDAPGRVADAVEELFRGPMMAAEPSGA